MRRDQWAGVWAMAPETCEVARLVLGLWKLQRFPCPPAQAGLQLSSYSGAYLPSTALGAGNTAGNWMDQSPLESTGCKMRWVNK